MGYVMATSECYGCGRLFSFNPVRVPSFRVEGVRQPICESCMTLVNEKRKAAGLEPFSVQQDAYEPCQEGEVW